jgi:periplasmic copper chaperone A
MRFKIPALAVLAGLAAALAPALTEAHEVTVKGVTVAHPWARATPEGQKVGAAFAEIKTDKDTSDRLIGVSSPVAANVEIHSMTMDGDVMKMRRLAGIDLKPGQSLVLKPMADHMMLFGLKEPLKEGDLVKLTLTFEKAGPIEVEGTVEAPGAMGPHGLTKQPVDDSMGSMHHDMPHE